MTDPLTVGIGVAAAAFILGLIFYFIASRDNFENWYSQQRQLEEEEKKKNKKPSKPKAKKNDAQKETQTKSEKRESVGAVKSEEEVDGKGKNKKNKKRDSESKAEPTPSPEAKKPEKKVDSPPAEKKTEKPKEQSIRERSPVKNKNDSEGFTEVKPKVKKSPEKSIEQLPEKTAVETPKEEKITVQKVKDAQKAPEPKKRKIDEMDMGKLLLDMAAGTVEQVHVQYLRSYVENVNKKEKATTSASQERNDLLKQIQTQTGKIRSLEETVAHHQTEKAGLTDHVNQLTAKEKQLAAELQKAKQMAAASVVDVDIIKRTQQQIVVLTKEVEHSKELAKRHEHAVAEVAALKRDLSAGEDQIASLVAKVSEMEAGVSHVHQLEGAHSEIAALKQRILGLEHELDDARKVEIESSEVTELKQKVKELQGELAEANKMKDALDTMQEKWNTLKASLAEHESRPQPAEYEAQIATLRRENAAHQEDSADWKQKHGKLMDEYLAMKALVDQIQGEVRNFEEMQRNVAEKQAQVDKQKEEITKFLKEQDALHAETLGLHKQIAELKKQLASGQSENGNLGEEVMIQKTTHTTAAAPDQTSAPPGSDYEKLAEENKRLQQKNDELRERNFKLFEMVENNSVQSSSNNAEAKAETVVHETKENKKKDKKANKKNDTPAPTHAPAAVTAGNDNSEDIKLVKSYRDALIAVKSELSRISDLAEQRRERIADLEARMNNGEWPKLHQPPTKVVPSAKASPSVAAATATPKATAAAGSKPAKKRTSGSEGGEEDWELVD